MNETFLLQEIEKYKTIIVQTSTEKKSIEQEIEVTKKHIQEFRSNFRQHVCNQILQKKSNSSSFKNSPQNKSGSLPNETRYLKPISIDQFDKSLPASTQNISNLQFLDRFQLSYQRDLASFNNINPQNTLLGQKLDVSNYTTPLNSLLNLKSKNPVFINEIKNSDDFKNQISSAKNSNRGKKSANSINNDNSGQELPTIESQEANTQNNSQNQLITIESQNSLSQFVDPQDLLPTQTRPTIPATQVDFNYSNTFISGDMGLSVLQRLKKQITPDNDRIEAFNDDTPAYYTPNNLTQLETQENETASLKTPLKIELQVIPPSQKQKSVNSDQYTLIEKNDNGQNLVKPSFEKFNLNHSPDSKLPLEPFKDLFLLPASNIYYENEESERFSRKSNTSQKRYSSNSKMDKDKKVSNILITFDNLNINQTNNAINLSKPINLQTKDFQIKNSETKEPVNFFEKNKGVLNKFDDFFKKSKEKKENTLKLENDELVLSQKTRDIDSIFPNDKDGFSSKKKCVYRYN